MPLRPSLAPNAPLCFSIACLSLAVLCGCREPIAGPQLGELEVYVATPLQEEVIDRLEFTGYTAADKSVEVRSRVSGYLKRVAFTEGAEVTGSTDPMAKSDVLCLIDDRPFVVVRDRYAAQLQAAKVQTARAERDLQRYRGLLPTGNITQEQFDKVLATFEEASASVKALEASLAEAQLNVDFATITAPMSGKVDRALVTDGNLIRADETIITTITSLDPMYVFFDIDEATMLFFQEEIRAGRLKATAEGDVPVDLSLQNEGDAFRHQGVLNFVGSQVNPATGSLQIRARFPNPVDPMRPKAPRTFLPGMFCRLRVVSRAKHPALLITERAVVTDLGKKFVYVVDAAGQVSARQVALGGRHDGLVEVLPDDEPGKGVKAGERIVVAGTQRVRPGEKIKTKNVPMAEFKATFRKLAAEAPPAKSAPAGEGEKSPH